MRKYTIGYAVLHIINSVKNNNSQNIFHLFVYFQLSIVVLR